MIERNIERLVDFLAHGGNAEGFRAPHHAIKMVGAPDGLAAKDRDGLENAIAEKEPALGMSDGQAIIGNDAAVMPEGKKIIHRATLRKLRRMS
jgi:hypothetical protein